MANNRAEELRAAAGGSNRAQALRSAAEPSGFLEDIGAGAMSQVRSYGAPFGVEQQEAPDTLGGRIGEVATESAVLGAPIGAGLSRIKPAMDTARGAVPKVQNFLSSIGASFRASPTRFTATEGALGGLSGAGGYYAEQMFPDTDGARFVGEVLGGFSPSIASGAARGTARGAEAVVENLPVSGPLYRGGRNVLQGARRLRDPLAQRRRAEQRFGRATADPEGAAAAMDEDLIPGLTPAARSGDEGLMRLEASVDAEMDDADKFIQSSLNEVNQNVRRAIQEFGEASPAATQETYERAQNALREALDERVKQAARKTENTLEMISPNAPREVVNETASAEIRQALTDMRAQESKLYEAVPTDAVVPVSNARKTFRNLLSEMPMAQRDDMPQIAREMLRDRGMAAREGGRSDRALGETTTIKELRGLQSRLRQEARNARSGDNANFNKARIADDIADAITDDIANAQGGEAVSGAVKTAVGFSRDLNERFRQGTVGKLLGYGQAGDVRTPPGLFLEKSIGVPGPKAREAFDDILKASNNVNVRDSLENFTRNRFFDYAVQDGQMNPNKARAFLQQNKELMRRMPRVALEIDTAIHQNNITDMRARRRQSIEKGLSPSVNKATMFIQKGPDQAFEGVLRSRNPSREMLNLVNMATRDTTGEAEQGLRKAFSDYIVSKSSTRAGDVSGQRLEKFLSDPKTRKAMMSLYTGPEIKRWEQIKNTMKRVDKQRAAKPSGEGTLGDAPGRVTTVIARLLGAASGTRLARLTGAGGIQSEAIMSESYKKLLDKGIDPSRRLIQDAIQDEQLFKDVLMAKTDEMGRVPKEARRRLNAWVASLGIEDEEENQ